MIMPLVGTALNISAGKFSDTAMKTSMAVPTFTRAALPLALTTKYLLTGVLSIVTIILLRFYLSPAYPDPHLHCGSEKVLKGHRGAWKAPLEVSLYMILRGK